MENFRLGYIGKEEITRALNVLEDNKDIKNIFVRVTHNDRVLGAEYDNIEDLLSDADRLCFYSFSNREDYIEYLDECEEINLEILELLETGTVYCDVDNNRFSNEVEDIVKPIVEDGKSHMYYTREDAIENLQGKYFNEALVVFLLNEY